MLDQIGLLGKQLQSVDELGAKGMDIARYIPQAFFGQLVHRQSSKVD